MDKLWAPWRMEYIHNHTNEDKCFLCHAVESSDNAATHVVRRSTTCLCLLNRYPYNNGHLLIAPFRHEHKLEGLSAEEMSDMMDLAVQAKQTLDKICSPNGFNLGMNLGRAAGAGLEAHLHLHLVPRWAGDTNYMAAIASTKVIPQALEEMWRLLREGWVS